VPVQVSRAYGTCSICELQCRVWEVEEPGVLLCRICLRLLVNRLPYDAFVRQDSATRLD
jgi:hypothetical protein